MNLLSQRGGGDHLAQLGRHAHHLVDTDASFDAFHAASVASFALPDSLAGGHIEVLGGGLVELLLFFAVLAEAAGEALRHDSDGGGRDQERLDAHFAEAGERAGGGVGVQGGEDHVSGERGFHGDVRGLFVAGLADQDHVRILAKEGAQDAGEVEPDIFVGLDLVDAVEVVLDGVFGGGDVDAGVVDLSQRGVERRRFAGAGGPGDVHDAVRLVDQLADLGEHVGIGDDFVEAKRGVRFIEDAHADLLAPLGGNGADAEVDRLAFHVDGNASVLRQALFGDVELAEDLEARYQAELNFLRQVLDRLQNAVEAEAHDHILFHGLDVDVAGALLDGESEDGITQADDGRVFGGVHQVLLVLADAGAGVFGELQVADDVGLQQIDHVLRPLGGGNDLGGVDAARLPCRDGLFVHELGVGGVHELAEILVGGDNGLDHHALDHPADVVERDDVVRIHHGE